MVRPVTLTKIAELKGAIVKSTELSGLLQRHYCSRDKEKVEKVLEILKHQVAYLHKITTGFDFLELSEKIHMIFVEMAIELEKVGEIYLSIIEDKMTADLSKLFQKAGLIDNRINLAVVKVR